MSTLTLSSLRALADAHLLKIPWVWGPFWNSAFNKAFMAGGRVLLTINRVSGTPNNRPLAFLKSFKVDLLKKNFNLHMSNSTSNVTYFLGDGFMLGFNSKTISHGTRLLLLQCCRSKPSSAQRDCRNLASWMEWGLSQPISGHGAESRSRAHKV